MLVMEGIQVELHGHRVKGLERRYEVVYRPIGLSLSRKQDNRLRRIPSLAAISSPGLLHKRGLPDSISDLGYLHSPPSPALSASTDSGSLPDSTNPSTPGESSHLVVFSFVRGEEIRIQADITSLDSAEALTLLFTAQDGVDGDAASGFTRALRKEYLLWTIRLLIFDVSWTPYQRARAAHELASLDTKEEEMKVESDGSIMVPRLELAAPPSVRAPLAVNKPWALIGGDVIQMDLPNLSPNHTVVEVSAVAADASGLWVFMGNSSSQPVVGITADPIASHICIHRGCIVESETALFTTNDGAVLLGPPILATTIVALAVGASAFSRPERLAGRHVLILSPDPELGAQILDVCNRLGMEATLLPSLAEDRLSSLYLRKPDFILSSTHDARDVSIIRSILASTTGRILLWNHPEHGLAGITRRDPWAVGDALRAALLYHENGRSPLVPYTFPYQLLPAEVTTASLSTKLFDSSKSYILVGGIGSLGLYIALWMYQVSHYACCLI